MFFAAAAFGFDEVFGGDLLAKIAVLFGAVAEERQAAAIAHRDGEMRVGKTSTSSFDHLPDG